MMAALIRATDFGRRVVPIVTEEAETLVAKGEARKLHRGLYEEVGSRIIAGTITVRPAGPGDEPEPDPDEDDAAAIGGFGAVRRGRGRPKLPRDADGNVIRS